MNKSIAFSANEIQLCKSKYGRCNQLAFGVILGYFKTYTKSLSIKERPLPSRLVSTIAAELNLDQSDIIKFDWNSGTAIRFRQEIREYLGFREPTDNDATAFIEYLSKDILPCCPSSEFLLEQARLYFNQNKIELFKDKQLKRYISSAKRQFEERFFHSIFENLDRDDCYYIDQMLAGTGNQVGDCRIVELSELKKDIPGARLKHVNYAVERITLLGKVKVPPSIFNQVDRKLLLQYYERIMALLPSNILEFSTTAKYATMAIFCHVRLQLMLDGLSDSFVKLIHRMRTSAESHVNQHILKEVKRVGGKFDILEKLASATANNPKGIIEDKVYPEVSKATLLEVIEDLKHRGRWYQQKIQHKIHSNYVHGNRGILLSILRAFKFHEDHVIYKPLLEAIEFINQHWNESDDEYYIDLPPIDDVVPTAWNSMVVTEVNDKKKANKYNYEIAILEQLKSFLGFKAIWIEGSYRYRNPNEDIPQDFDKKRKHYYKLLGLPTNAKQFIKRLKQSLKSNLTNLNTNIMNNDLVRIRPSSINKNIVISPSEAQDEPLNIAQLQKDIVGKWSSINLIDILKECDLLINFTEQMETIARSSNIPADTLRKRLLLCLYAIGSNTGLKRISIANGDVNYDDLRYVKNRFINKANVRGAIKQVINHVLEVRDPEIWGEATTTVACDSTQISAWDQNLLNEWHHRYKGKGVMIYWHVDKKSLCIYSQLKSCSSSEVGAMIKGVIDHDTKMNMDRIFVDTHGQSVIGFAVSHLLDFDLLPRFKAINRQKLYGVTSQDKKRYTNISLIIKGTINWQIIEDNYDEIVKYMVALKLGIIDPSVLVKRFSHDNYNHPVYKALLEIGKANKSMFLCKYLDSEELRIEINEGLNVVERLNNAMDFIFYGKLGELKTNNTDNQELSVLCLHLLQACMVYINTLIIQQVLSEPHWANKLTPEDYRALTPLFSSHINPYGLFPIDLNQRIAISNKPSNTSYEATHDKEQSYASTRESKAVLKTA
tara:strand:+ start:186 stop:3188 length:3003 start_codon:yes stop_codon:yes gene_type:complete